MKIRRILKKLAKLLPVLKWLFLIYIVVGFAFTTYVFLAETPPILRSEAIGIIGKILILIGTLYAAYDLLGGVHGPLRWVTLVMTYAVIGVIAIEHFPVLFAISDLYSGNQNADNNSASVGLIVGIVGALTGILAGILIALRTFADAARRRKTLSILIAGITGALIILLFLIAIRDSGRMDLARLCTSVAAGFVAAGLMQWWQLFTYRESSKRFLSLQQKPERIFSWKNGAIGLAIAILFAAVFVFGRGSRDGSDFWFFLLVFCASPIAAAGFSYSLFWKVSSFSKNTLAVFGLVVILVGSVIQFWTPITTILENTRLPKIGKAVRDGNLHFTVTNVTDPCFLPPTVPQGKLYCVMITVHNVGDTSSRLLDSDQQLLSSTGRQFWADTNPQLYSHHKDNVAARVIKPGERIDLMVAFDIPRDQNPVTIQLHDSSSRTSNGVKVRLIR